MDAQLVTSVGKDRLEGIVAALRRLVDGAVAVYEADGRIAAESFDSPYCRFLNESSRRLCGTADDEAARASGRWHCHESCWQKSSAVTVSTGRPYDLSPCDGGISVYAVPIVAGDEVIGSINFGYGTPPTDPATLDRIARRYQVSPMALAARARHHRPRPDYIIAAAKAQLRETASQIGELYRLRQAEARTRDRERTLRNLTANIADVTYTVRGDGVHLFISDNVESVAGIPAAAVLAGDDWQTRIHPADRDRVLKAFRDLFEHGKALDLEYRYYRPDGRWIWIHDVALAVYEKDGLRYCDGVFRDVTQRKRAEEELRAARGRAEEASRAKSRFLARMSHELRTPLNAILGFAQVMETDRDHLLPAPHREGVEQIRKAGWHLLELVNQLLDLAAIEAGHLELNPEPVAVAARVAEAVDLIRPLADERGVRLETAPVAADGTDPWVEADPVRLRQVLLNLLSNAVKHGGAAGTVTVGWEAAANGGTRITVSDTGPGIPPADQETIFEPFSRSYLVRPADEGTGIGLSISRQLVEGMGGRIGVVSTVGAGSTFWVELRRSEAARPAGAPAGDPVRAAGIPACATVLYVEDSPSHVRLMERIVGAGGGVRLMSAPTAALGLEMAAAHRPDLVVTDLRLPGMDGFELLAALRAGPGTRDIPVIAVTADTTPGARERGLAAGFQRWLTKPLDVAAFRGALAEVRQGKAARGAAAATGLRRVLVAEDDSASAWVAQQMLKRLGYESVVATDGERVLERLAEGFCAVLLDVELPQLDGLAVARAIRGRADALGHIPVIGLTGGAGDGTAACRRAGMDQVLLKPVTLGALEEALARHLEAPAARPASGVDGG